MEGRDAFHVEVQPVGGPPGEGRDRGRRRRLAAGLVLAAATLGVVALAVSLASRPDQSSPAPARPARIAVVDEAGNLTTVGADGSDRRAWAIPGMGFQFPAWSPDGRRIAAIGSDASHGAVFVAVDRAARDGGSAAPPGGVPRGGTAPVAGSAPTAVAGSAPAGAGLVTLYSSSTELPIYLYWSPDGQRITFITSEPDGIALRVVAADGSGPASVVRQGQPMYWDWVDASHLLVHSGGNASGAFLGEVGLDASARAPITAAVGEFQAPAVSAGGHYRAYVSAAPSGSNHVVAEAADGSARHEAEVTGATSLEWSPAGAQLAFTSPAQANDLPVGPLYVMDAATGTKRLVLDAPVIAYFWAPDARTIAALEIVLQNTNPSGAVPGFISALGRPPAQASGVGLELAFVDAANGSVRSRRSVELPDLLVNQFLPFFDQYARSDRVWSPASDSIVLPLVDSSGAPHVMIVPADGSTPRQLVDGITAFWGP